MPEWAEANHMAVILNSVLQYHTMFGIVNTNIIINYLDQLVHLLPLVINKIFARGKKIIFELIDNQNNFYYMISSLGMTGRWVFQQLPSSRICLSTGVINDSGITYDQNIFYDDQRGFGDLELAFNPNQALGILQYHMGPDIVHDDVQPQQWIQAFLSATYRNWMVTKALLHQKVFAGIGNYLRAEIMYASAICPYRKISSLTNEEMTRLLVSAKRIMKEAFEAKGFTIERYLDPFGQRGTFQVRVYKMNRDPNGYPIRHDKIESKTAQVTHWCPQVQCPQCPLVAH